MKNLNRIILCVAFGACLSLASCSKDDDTGGTGNAPSGTLTAKVDGANYQSMNISSSATIANAGGVQNLVIIASNSEGNAFAITIFGYTGEGTYKLTGADVAVTNTASYTETNVNLSNPTASTTEIWQAPYDNTEVGAVSITEETSTNIKGTFSFTGKNVNGDNSVKSITEGSFDLSKQTT